MRRLLQMAFAAAALGASTESSAEEEPPDADEGTFFYVGGAIQAPLPILFSGSLGEGVGASFRAGYVHHYFELLVDVSPNAMFNVANEPMGLLDSTVTVGCLVPMSPHTSWVLRAGGGGGVALGLPTLGFGEVRADVFGVVVRTSEHVRVELDVPSFRVFLDGQGLRGMTWITALSFQFVL